MRSASLVLRFLGIFLCGGLVATTLYVVIGGDDADASQTEPDPSAQYNEEECLSRVEIEKGYVRFTTADQPPALPALTFHIRGHLTIVT
jgi:hypothetical protein